MLNLWRRRVHISAGLRKKKTPFQVCFKGYVLLTVIYLGNKDELSQDYTSNLHRQNVIVVWSKNYLLKSGKARFFGIHTSPALAPTDKLQ